MSMLGLADSMLESLPFFTEEERAKINRVYKHYREKYGHKTSFGTVPMLQRQVEMDLTIKEAQLKKAAGIK
jgi:hypothetical protein